MATAVLPPLLPTPPRSKMMPLLPTPCLVILPASFASPSTPKPGRADSDERWDAHKKPCSPASSDSSGSPGRASACERWDSKKKSPRGASSSSERSRGSSKSPGRSSSCERCDSNKRPPSRASSADRWDIHKKPRSQTTDGLDGGLTAGKHKEQEIDKPQTEEATKVAATDARTETVKLLPVFSGASFFASPEPSMLPTPSFLLQAF